MTISAASARLRDAFVAKYSDPDFNLSEASIQSEMMTDLKELARNLCVDIPADRIRLFYAKFGDELEALSNRYGSKFGVVNNTDASEVLFMPGSDLQMLVTTAFADTNPDFDIRTILNFPVGSPGDIMSARYAEAAKGPITIVTEQAFVTPGDPEKSSILNRTEVKVLLGQPVELDGVTYRNTDVPEINGISRSTLLGGTVERILPEAEYQKAFNSIEVVSRAEFNILKKAVGDSSAQGDEARKVIEQLGFGDVTQTLGRATDKFLQGDLDKLSITVIVCLIPKLFSHFNAVPPKWRQFAVV